MGASVLFVEVFLSQLPLSDAAKNVVGITFLFGPLLYVAVQLLAPGLVDALISSMFRRKSTKSSIISPTASPEEERVAFHEAGHFLAGYICGIPILEYSVATPPQGPTSRNAGTSLAASIPSRSAVIQSLTSSASPSEPSLKAILRESRAGGLLIVSMAGMVAETLRFGDSRGGAEDLPLALALLQSYGVPREERDDYLRWAVLKALVMLRIHREALEEVAAAMLRGDEVADCMALIEQFGDMDG